MQHRPCIPITAHLGYNLSPPDWLAFLDEQATVVCIGAQKQIIVFDNQQITVADQAIAAVYDPSWRGCFHRLACLADNIDAFVAGLGKTFGNRSLYRPLPVKL